MFISLGIKETMAQVGLSTTLVSPWAQTLGLSSLLLRSEKQTLSLREAEAVLDGSIRPH
jgi:hypothetical protein